MARTVDAPNYDGMDMRPYAVYLYGEDGHAQAALVIHNLQLITMHGDQPPTADELCRMHKLAKVYRREEDEAV